MPATDEPTGEWVPFEDEDRAEEEATPPEEATSAPEIKAPLRAKRRRSGRPPRARRIVAWLLPVVLLLGAGLGAVGWYARRTFYVGLSEGRVMLFRGVPGGLLGWEPTVEARSSLGTEDLTPAQRADLEDGHRFPSRSEAARFLERLEESREATSPSTSTTFFILGNPRPTIPGPSGGGGSR